jgi:hypothetical protein
MQKQVLHAAVMILIPVRDDPRVEVPVTVELKVHEAQCLEDLGSGGILALVSASVHQEGMFHDSPPETVVPDEEVR